LNILSENISTVKNIAFTCSQSLTEKKEQMGLWNTCTWTVYSYTASGNSLKHYPLHLGPTVWLFQNHIWNNCFITWSIQDKRKKSINFANNFVLIINFLTHLSTKCSVSYCDSRLSVVRKCVSTLVRACVNIFIQTTSPLKPLIRF